MGLSMRESKVDASALAGSRVLVVEDETLISMFLKNILLEHDSVISGKGRWSRQRALAN
jgi:hypothetical protein